MPRCWAYPGSNPSPSMSRTPPPPPAYVCLLIFLNCSKNGDAVISRFLLTKYNDFFIAVAASPRTDGAGVSQSKPTPAVPPSGPKTATGAWGSSLVKTAQPVNSTDTLSSLEAFRRKEKEKEEKVFFLVI